MGISKGYVSGPHNHHPVRSLPAPKVNILISHTGHACLADFSLLAMTSDQSTVMSSQVEGGTVRWMSPELFDPESFGLRNIRPTKESDCYALGMVIYEVLSGQAPFTPWQSPLVIQKVLKGERPERPQGAAGKLFTDLIWELVELCWKHQPSNRPCAKTVLLCLEGAPLSSHLSSDVDGVAEADTDRYPDDVANDSGTFSPLRAKS